MTIRDESLGFTRGEYRLLPFSRFSWLVQSWREPQCEQRSRGGAREGQGSRAVSSCP